MDWFKYIRNNKIPDDIPRNPAGFYRRTGWKDWFDWLGAEKKVFLSYEKAKNFVHTLELSGEEEWRKYKKGLFWQVLWWTCSWIV